MRIATLSGILFALLILALSCSEVEQQKVPTPVAAKPPEPAASAPPATPEQPAKLEPPPEPEEAKTEPFGRYEHMTVVERAKEAVSLVKEGTDDFNRGDIDSAISKFEEALQLAPDWTKARRDYAELLYHKGLAYSQHSEAVWQKTLGKVLDQLTGSWKQSATALSKEEKAELEKDSREAQRKAASYFRKSLEQLQKLDKMLEGADENVTYAMAIVYIHLDELDQAKTCFERVLDSPRLEEKMKEKIRAAIEAINKFQNPESP